MRLERTEAIVLHTYPSRERDKMVVFLTPEHGKVKGYAYGARGIKSRFGAALEPLAKVKIGYASREAEEIVRIESVELVRSLFPCLLRLRISWSSSGLHPGNSAPVQSEKQLNYKGVIASTRASRKG